MQAILAIFQKLENREEFEGALTKNLQKQERIPRGMGGILLAVQNIYPWILFKKSMPCKGGVPTGVAGQKLANP